MRRGTARIEGVRLRPGPFPERFQPHEGPTWEKRPQGETNEIRRTMMALLSAVPAGTLSVRELADLVGLSWTPTVYHLVALRDLGYVEWSPGRGRTIRVLVPFVTGGGNP